jgi:hypothetical protein
MKKRIATAVMAVTALVFTATALFAQGYNYKSVLKEEKSQGALLDQYDENAKKNGMWIIGAGAAINRLPVAASEFTLPLFYFGYEALQKKALGEMDYSWCFGFYDFMPSVEFAAYINAKPFDFRFSAGGYYDLIIGGSAGVVCKAGVVINKSVGFDVLMIPVGTQPSVSYSESLKTGKVVENDGSHGLEFPVYGVMVNFRF